MLRLRHFAALSVAGSLTLAAAAPALWQDMEMPKPTEEHAMIQKGVGVWEGTVTMFMPGMPETPTPATEVVRSEGPFWITSDFKSSFMGMDYNGHGCHGYDPVKGKYVSTWIDSMSSYLSVMEGTHNAETNAIEMTWEAPDMTGQLAPHRSEQVLSEDAYTMTFYTSGEKTMVIDMKRTGGAAAVEAGAKK